MFHKRKEKMSKWQMEISLKKNYLIKRRMVGKDKQKNKEMKSSTIAMVTWDI